MDQAALSAAVAGDRVAFTAVVRPHRAELAAHCYRMLGSRHDAEDALQDVLTRAWLNLHSFGARSSLRTWLFRIATNTCLNAIDARSRRWLPVDVAAAAVRPPEADEVRWLEPLPDADLGPQLPAARYEVKESVELAFVAAVQQLSGRQRAVVLLRDVLGFSAAETAALLDTTVAAVNSALQHARTRLRDRVPRDSQQQSLRALGDERVRVLVEKYAAAFEASDVPALIDLLTEDATWSMPPSGEVYRGVPAIREFLTHGPSSERWRHRRITANGQPAVACYVLDEHSGRYTAAVIDVLAIRGEKIASVTAFIDANAFAAFGLPAALDADERTQ